MMIHSVLAKVPLYTAALGAQTRLQSLTSCFSTHQASGILRTTPWEAAEADEGKQACIYTQQSLCVTFPEEAFHRRARNDWPPLVWLVGFSA